MENKEKTDKPPYIPETGTVWPEKPDEPLIAEPPVRHINLDADYTYLDTSLKARLKTLGMYFLVHIIAFPANSLRYGLKVKGRKNVFKNRKLLANGAITIANHVYRWDFISVVQAFPFRVFHYPARKNGFESKDWPLLQYTGGIPLAETIGGMKKFNLAFNSLHEQKKWIHIFPESCRWDFYQPIRPFKRGAFEFAYRYGVPVIPMAFSYRKPGKLRTLLHMKAPLITLNIGEPIMPDTSLSRKESSAKLRKQCFDKMVELAGITDNKWPAEGD